MLNLFDIRKYQRNAYEFKDDNHTTHVSAEILIWPEPHARWDTRYTYRRPAVHRSPRIDENVFSYLFRPTDIQSSPLNTQAYRTGRPERVWGGYVSITDCINDKLK